MIPIRDDNPSGRFPIITVALIVANIIVFIYMLTLSPVQLNDFVLRYSLIPNHISQWRDLPTIFTAMFLHGSIGHIFGNMLFLNIFGNNMEYAYGHFKFLIFYLLAGIGAAALQVLIGPALTIPNLGASGAIAGVMGGYLVLFPHNLIEIAFPIGFAGGVRGIPAYYMIFYWFIIQLISGVGSLAIQTTGGIAYFAHVGGFITGFVVTQVVRGGLRVRKYVPPEPEPPEATSKPFI